jgi:AraC-like DNA-binding protein
MLVAVLSAASRDAYIEDPVGTYFTGPCYFCWCAHEGLYGASIWGEPSLSDMRGFVELLSVEQRAAAQPHKTIVDFRHLRTVGAESFDLVANFLLESAPRLATLLTRQWLVRPEGMMGQLIAYHYGYLRLPYEVRVVTDPREAFAQAAPEHAELAAEIIELEAFARTGGSLLLALRRHLAEASPDTDLAASARALGVSTRTLQRQLRGLGTSYVREVRRARIERAKALLLGTDLKLTTLALEAGFPSVQQLCAAFRESEGCSPGRFRQRRASALGPRARRTWMRRACVALRGVRSALDRLPGCA